jgi:hypothetical protein
MQTPGKRGNMIQIGANIPFVEPPQWALLERSLIDLMDQAVAPVMERYVRADDPAGFAARQTSRTTHRQPEPARPALVGAVPAEKSVRVTR